MKVKLKTLTPLFIGKGEELITYNWYINFNNIENNSCFKGKAYILKKDLISILLEELKLKGKYIKKILHKKDKAPYLNEIESAIKNSDFLEKEEILKKIKNYKLELNVKTYDRKKIESKKLELFNFLEKDNELFFYIPGSSIKGTLRTYVVFKLLLEINNLLGNKFEYLANTKIKNKLIELRENEETKPKENGKKKQINKQINDVINSLKNDSEILLLKFIYELIESFLSGMDFNFNDLGKKAKLKIKKGEIKEIIEGKKQFKDIILNFIKKNRNKLEDWQIKFLEELEILLPKIENLLKQYSWLYGFFKATNFIIRDSEFLDLKDFIVLEVKRKKGSKEKQGIPNFILALDENKEADFELVIKQNKEEFFKFLKKEVNSNHPFPIMKDNALELEMGRFAGANFKSFLAFLMDIYPSTINYTCDNKRLGKIKLIF